MNIPVGSWQLWAVLSAAFAALTAIFAKVGIENINSDFTTLSNSSDTARARGHRHCYGAMAITRLHGFSHVLCFSVFPALRPEHHGCAISGHLSLGMLHWLLQSTN